MSIVERLFSIRIKGQIFNTALICVHAPLKDANEEEKDKFDAKFEDIYEKSPRYGIKIVMGDINAKTA